MPSKIEGNKSLEKALNLFDAFTIDRPKLGIQHLESITKMPRATLYRIINPLLERNYLQFDKNNNTYSLGIKFYERAGVVKKGFELNAVLTKHLDWIASQMNHTVTVAIMRDNRIIQIDMREHAEGIKIGTYIGKITKPTHGVLGKVFMAYMSREKAKSLLEQYPPARWEGKTEYTWDDVSKTLDGIQKRKYIFSENDVIDGISGVATPVFNSRTKCIAVISILVPTFNFDGSEKDRCLQLCKQFSEHVSKDMGCMHPIY